MQFVKFPMRDSDLLRCWPIGSVYISMTNQNPSSLFGGTWELISENRMLMGASSDETETSIGGSNTKTISVNNLPAHNHTATISSNTHTHIFSGNQASTSEVSDHIHTIDLTTSTDGLHSHTYGSTTSTMSLGSSVYSANNNNSYTTSENGEHSHTVTGDSGSAGAHSHTYTPQGTNSDYTHDHTVTIDNTGAGEALDVTNAYMKVFMWRRLTQITKNKGR